MTDTPSHFDKAISHVDYLTAHVRRIGNSISTTKERIADESLEFISDHLLKINQQYTSQLVELDDLNYAALHIDDADQSFCDKAIDLSSAIRDLIEETDRVSALVLRKLN